MKTFLGAKKNIFINSVLRLTAIFVVGFLFSTIFPLEVFACFSCPPEPGPEPLCEEGETLATASYESMPQTVYIDESEDNVADRLCKGCGCTYLSLDTSDGDPHYIYMNWNDLDLSLYDGVLSLDLLLQHKEASTVIKVELKDESDEWVEVCDPDESVFFTWDTCDLMPYLNTLEQVDDIELRLVAEKTGACHEYLKCAKLSAEMYNCEGPPEPVCGNQILEEGEECEIGYDCECGFICNQETCLCEEVPPEPYCGDGNLDQGEECDDGNNEDGDGCSANCVIEVPPEPVCGNQILEEGEECDDGNTEDGDGCSSICMIEEPEPPVCDPEIELVINGGFESPVVETTQGWDIFEGSEISGWDVEWVSLNPSIYESYSRPTNASLEFQAGVNDWASYEGDQYVELDTDWDGPGGSLSGEPASVKIYQDINTIPGEEYTITFYFSPRPQESLIENRLELSWGSEVVDDTITAAGENTTAWTKYEYVVSASAETTRLEFADLGNSNSVGTFLDNVSVRCKPSEPTEPYCGDGECNGDETCETCPEDCGECPPTCVDGDQDGYYAYDEVYCPEGNDCDDEDSDINPGAEEICDNQIDDDCDTYIDCEDEDCDGDSACEEPEPSVCGNGELETGEQCDDGNTENGDGCSSTCTIESTPSNGGNGGGGGGTPGYCGDGRLQLWWDEECDDGNKIEGDGCSSSCRIEGVGGEQTPSTPPTSPPVPPAPPAPTPTPTPTPTPSTPPVSPPVEVAVVGTEVSEEEEIEECPVCEPCESCEEEQGLLASVFGLIGEHCYDCIPWWIVLFFAAYALMKVFIKRKIKKGAVKYWLSWFVILIALAVVFYFWPYHCVAIWVYLVLGLINGLIWFKTSAIKSKTNKIFIFVFGLVILFVFLLIWLLNKCVPLWWILILLALYFVVALLLGRKGKEDKTKPTMEQGGKELGEGFQDEFFIP